MGKVEKMVPWPSLLTLLTTALAVVAAWSAEDPRGSPITPLIETLDEQANVALDRRIRGIVERSTFDSGYSATTDAFEVRAGPGELCMRYRSRDGLYNARQDFSIARTGWNTIPFETTHREALEGLGTAGLAILALDTPACADPSAEQRVAPVRRRGEGGTAFYLIAHTDGDEARVVVQLDRLSSPIVRVCAQLSGSRLTAFDAKCPLPREAFEPSAKVVLVRLLPDGRLQRTPVPLVAF